MMREKLNQAAEREKELKLEIRHLKRQLAKKKKNSRKAEKRKKRREEERKKRIPANVAAHQSLLKMKQNRRAYLKRRPEMLKATRDKIEARLESGDVKGYHSIIITKNKKKVEHVTHRWWLYDAQDTFDKLVKQNSNDVLFPTTVDKVNKPESTVEYEILLLQKTNGMSENVTGIKDKDGKYVDHVIVDRNDYRLLDKRPWRVEETFYVYGYHPGEDRKDCRFIIDELIRKGATPVNIKQVFTFGNKVFIKTDDDFDFVLCKDENEALRLYDALEIYCEKLKIMDRVFFTGPLPEKLKSNLINEMVEKTGWTRHMCSTTWSNPFNIPPVKATLR